MTLLLLPTALQGQNHVQLPVWAIVVLAAAPIFVAIIMAIAQWRSWREFQKASVAGSEGMYYAFNRFVIDEIKHVGALTPYRKEMNDDETGVRMRFFFLQLFNRWRFELGGKDIRASITFREYVFGNSLADYYDRIRKRKYPDSVAKLCVRVLHDIRETEPYFKDGMLWDAYFDGYKWDLPAGC